MKSAFSASRKFPEGRPPQNITQYIRNSKPGEKYLIHHQETKRDNSRLRSAPIEDGIYNYIIFYDESPKFILVNPIFNIGTKHYHLRGDSKGHIMAAGELKVEGGKIIFNIESGTYTKVILDRVRNKGAVKSFLIQGVKKILERYSNNVRYTSSILVKYVSMINASSI